jgi:hypothetical protein
MILNGLVITIIVFLPYKLIRHLTFPMRSWFYSPFKVEKEELLKVKAY